MSGEGDLRELPRFPPLLVASSLGALWGAAGYAVLWGHTPLTVSRAFVLSALGTALLLPVRLVLGSIRLAEGVLGRSFTFADANWWIGALAAVVGAAVAGSLLLAARALVAWRCPGRRGP